MSPRDLGGEAPPSRIDPSLPRPEPLVTLTVGAPEVTISPDRAGPSALADAFRPAHVGRFTSIEDVVAEFAAELKQAIDPTTVTTALGLLTAAGVAAAASGAVGSAAPGWAAHALTPLAACIAATRRSRRFGPAQRLTGWRRPRQPGFAPD